MRWTSCWHRRGEDVRLRDGKAQEIALEDTVPVTWVELNAGDVIPGDCRVLEFQCLVRGRGGPDW